MHIYDENSLLKTKDGVCLNWCMPLEMLLLILMKLLDKLYNANVLRCVWYNIVATIRLLPSITIPLQSLDLQ